VANADNDRQKHADLKADRDSLKKKAAGLSEQVNEKIDQARQSEEKLTAQIASLKAENVEMKTKLSNAEREKAELLQKVNSWASITKDFSKTTDQQTRLLEETQKKLSTIEADLIKEKREHEETTATLMERMAIIDTIKAENKRLMEEKTDLQSRFDRYLQPMGKTAGAAVAVTPRVSRVKPAAPITKDIGLQALITVVDLKNSMAAISIGSTDGVKEGMRFHVTRGDQFICDILIIEVDAEEAVGVLELIQQSPRVGDSASTNL
jgi:predicted RNase H-like nuclease (RuvC/YqgF family)